MKIELEEKERQKIFDRVLTRLIDKSKTDMRFNRNTEIDSALKIAIKDNIDDIFKQSLNDERFQEKLADVGKIFISKMLESDATKIANAILYSVDWRSEI